MGVWIVGQVRSPEKNNWEFAGVYSLQKSAEDACRNFKYFVGHAFLDEQLPDETFEWPDAYYPIQPTQEEYDAFHKAK